MLPLLLLLHASILNLDESLNTDIQLGTNFKWVAGIDVFKPFGCLGSKKKIDDLSLSDEALEPREISKSRDPPWMIQL